MNVPGQEEKENLSFLHLFVLLLPSTDRMKSTYIGEGRSSLPNILIQMLSCSGNILAGTPRNNILSAIWPRLKRKLMPSRNMRKASIARGSGVSEKGGEMAGSEAGKVRKGPGDEV